MKGNVLFLLLTLLHLQALTQVVKVNTYYDPGANTIPRESFSAMGGDTASKQGLYRLFSREGLILEEAGYQRDENGLIRLIGQYKETGEQLILQFSYDYNTKFNYLLCERRYLNNVEKIRSLPFSQPVTDSLNRLLFRMKTEGDSLTARYLTRHDQNIKRVYLNGEKIESLLAQGDYYLYKVATLIADFPVLRENEKRISRFQEKINSKYASITTKGLQGDMADLSGGISAYFAGDSVEDGYYRGFLLIGKISKMESLLDELALTDNLLKKDQQFLTDHYSGNSRFQVLYKKRIIPILDSISAYYETQNALDQKLLTGRTIHKNAAPFIARFGELASRDSLVKQDFDRVTGKYNETFPSKFPKEMNQVKGLYSQYDSLTNLEAKFKAAEVLVKKLKGLGVDYETLASQSSFFKDKYPPVIDYYKNQQPNIYFKELDPLEKKVTEYQSENNLGNRIIQGKDLIEKVSYLSASIDTLKWYGIETQTMLVMVKNKYKENYRKIYVAEIEPKEFIYDDYKSAVTISSKLKKGKEVYRWLKKLNDQYEELQKQLVMTDSLLKLNMNLYWKKFSNIKDYEITEIRKSFTTYKSLDMLEARIQLGRSMLEELGFIRISFDTLVKLDTLMNNLYPIVRKQYRVDFDIIFKEKILVLRDKMNDLSAAPNVQMMLQTDREILEKLNLLNSQYPALKKQLEEIQAEIKRFNELFGDDKSKRIIFRKATRVIDQDNDKYIHGKDVEVCTERGKDLLHLLKTINDYAKDDTEWLTKQLENLMTEEEIRKVFIK
ncbi:MAG: hypothetical protein NTU44_07760 [Bacteroidetes bacterium]|nr:hypothetical protein [Bacteroidota bacterium]